MKKYVAKKWPSPSKPNTFYWTVFCLDSSTGDYLPDGKKRMSIGQMLCHIECPNLEKWNFVSQKFVCDYTITRYFYPAADGDDRNVELEVVEDHTPPAPRIVRRKTKCVKSAAKNRRM